MLITSATRHPQPPYPLEPPRGPTPPPAQPSPPPARATVLHASATTVPSGSDPVLDRLLEERIVFLGREVDDEIANRISAQLLLLAAQDSERDITLYINSPGGSVTAGMAIYDTMRLIRPDVATWAVGFAASMGQFLLSAGARGKRHALPHTRILMHQPSAGIGGNATDIAIRAGVYAEMKREIAEITAGHSGQTFETITADSDRDRWFTAAQAREYGLVDHVVDV
ncbi:ATP-dependent Clp protease proteolytic subunit [Pseudonocardia sp. MH-G8]|uniref:ATP-dependent Clp protease proteolytic subunit n=1 Tax=Pseudonocardia sp. MH-G8 TaxID=1854588 RepID=UPI000BA04ABB|nr:ATP-dependent Clp protease proteolytic subunit [Pseudonocardia sp. MH-G8]OZM81960.1 ATP-dependent Clp protease proteolytic subunit [Pseudonocardia sp. MH-G8]